MRTYVACVQLVYANGRTGFWGHRPSTLPWPPDDAPHRPTYNGGMWPWYLACDERRERVASIDWRRFWHDV